jgi:DNA-binding NtrC family response regulator
MVKNVPLLLVIDDEKDILQELKEALQDEEYNVETLSDGRRALELIGELVPDLVLLDIFMPNVSGIDVLDDIKREYPRQKVMIISGFGSISVAVDAIQKGALNFIEKPLNLDDILRKISFLKDDKFSQSRSTFEDFGAEKYGVIGRSFLFLEVVNQLNNIAVLNLPVMIYGQHGTGKSLVARYIHKKSKLLSQQFYTFNCATAGSVELLESMLEKSGTLYLKNVDCLNSRLQKVLLDYLVNSQNDFSRVVASSNKSLFDLVKKGVFSDHLFCKINVTPLEIPPLNKRRFDIPLLVDYFLNKENAAQNKNIVFSSSSIRTIRNHDWFGNVSELKIFVKKMVQVTKDDDLVVDPRVLCEYLSERSLPFIQEQSFNKLSSLNEALTVFEKKFLLYHLKKNRYDLNQVSDRLSLGLCVLKDRMLKLGIEYKA